MSLLKQLQELRLNNKKGLAVLIDPDCCDNLITLVEIANTNHVTTFFVGGSLLTSDSLEETLNTIKKHSSIPCYIFPGNTNQISNQADGILFLSLISGRNPDYLIGQHVTAAPLLKQTNIDVLPTGYMLIDGGKPTSVSYMSNTNPIPYDKPNIAGATALAGEYLGLQTIYMEAGSGAQNCISEQMVSSVKNQISIPLIIGGGIKNINTANAILNAGADLIVVGNHLEKKPEFIKELMDLIKSKNHD